MNVLAFDCCFSAVSAAVRRSDGLLRAVRYEVLPRGNAERLFQLIDEVLVEAKLAANDIDRIAVTLGPGTFTGVRVGVAAARALSLGLGKPVVGITSLAAMARRAEQLLKPGEASYPMVIAVDARRDMIYLQRFEDVSGGAGDPVLSTAAEVAIDVLRTPNGPLLAVGSGGKAFAEAMRIAGYECDAKFPDLQPDALSIAELAPKLKPLERVVPLYLRQPDVRVRETLSLLGTRK